MHNIHATSKQKKTCIALYGVEHPQQLPTVKEKAKNTCMLLYGGASSTNSPSTIAKMKKTNLARHGAESYTQTEEFKKKAAITNTMLYGSENWRDSHMSNQTKILLNDVEWMITQNKTKTITQIAIELGVSEYTVYDRFKRFNITTKRHAASFFEKQIFEYVESIHSNIIQNDRQQIKPYELDVYLPDLNLAFECNGEYWHKEPQKEINKFDMCKEKGIELHFIWYKDWQKDQDNIKEKIKTIIESKKKI